MICLHSGVEAAFDLTQIPGDALIEKRIRLICSIDGSLIAQRFPVLRLYLEVRVDAGGPLTLPLLEVLQHLAGLADVLELVVAILSIDILFNRCCRQIKKLTVKDKNICWTRSKVSFMFKATVQCKHSHLTYRQFVFGNSRKILILPPNRLVLVPTASDEY